MGRVRAIKRHRVIGIDTGSQNVGWAVLSLDDDGRIRFEANGTWCIQRDKNEGAGMMMLKLSQHMTALLREVKPDALAFERIDFHRGTEAAHTYGASSHKVMEECEVHGVPYCGIPLSTARKKAIGKGNASKEEAKAVLEKVFGVVFDSADSADAGIVALAWAVEAGWYDGP